MSFSWSETWMTIHRLDPQNKVTYPLPHMTLPWLIYSILARTPTPFVPTHRCLQACTHTHKYSGLTVGLVYPLHPGFRVYSLSLGVSLTWNFLLFLSYLLMAHLLSKSTSNLTFPKDISPIPSNRIISLLTWNPRASHGDKMTLLSPWILGVRAFVLWISVYLL